MAPTVSVIIPTYNHQRYLSVAIDSAISQNIQPLEIIVIDDGSTDNTREIVKKYQRIQYHFQKNSGPSAARNHGARIATADYLIFLDSDDALLPDAIEKHIECISYSPGAAMVSATFVTIAPDGSTFKNSQPHPGPSSPNHYESLLERNYIGMPASALLNRKTLISIGGFDESLSGCEDYDLYLRITRNFFTAYHHNVIAHYRKGQAGLSTNGIYMLQCANTVLDRQHEFTANSANLIQAMASGRRNFEMVYGKRIFYTALQHLHRGQFQLSISCIKFLFSYSPNLATHQFVNAVISAPRFLYRYTVRKIAN